jgi:hypothetical protein
MALRCHGLTPIKYIEVFEVFLGLEGVLDPLAKKELYPLYLTYEAVPKYISEKTSYLGVR